MTCFDQASGLFAWVEDGDLRTGAADELVERLEAATGLALTAGFTSATNDTGNKMHKVF